MPTAPPNAVAAPPSCFGGSPPSAAVVAAAPGAFMPVAWGMLALFERRSPLPLPAATAPPSRLILFGCEGRVFVTPVFPAPRLLPGGRGQWPADDPPEGVFAVAAADAPPAPDADADDLEEEEDRGPDEAALAVLRGFRLQYLVPCDRGREQPTTGVRRLAINHNFFETLHATHQL